MGSGGTPGVDTYTRVLRPQSQDVGEKAGLILRRRKNPTLARATNCRRAPQRAAEPMPRLPRHVVPSVEVPHFPMGINANTTALHTACPSRNYKGCFSAALERRFPSFDLSDARRDKDLSLDAPAYAQRLFPRCAVNDARTSSGPRAAR